MKYFKVYFLSGILILIVSWSCSDVNEDITTPPAITVHNSQFAVEGSDNHHAVKIRESNWDIKTCQQCHASDYSGGITGKSCLTCHTETGGPEACNVCHGDKDDISKIEPPEDLEGNITPDNRGVGAHGVHRRNTEFRDVIECSECHIVPSSFDAATHIDDSPHAEVTFGTLANSGSSNASYDTTSLNCSNVYCHGNFSFGKTSDYTSFAYLQSAIDGEKPTWNWLSQNHDAECGTCHGLPPTGHIYAEKETCVLCHSETVDASGEISNKSKHIDGIKEVIAETSLEKCNFCHGDNTADPADTTNAAPPRALNGSTDPTYRGVGAHAAHLSTTSFASAVQCGECHIVPARYDAVGHFDSTKYAEVTFGEIKGVSLSGTASYDNSNLTCSNVFCHGDFKNGNADNVVSWTGGPDQAKCGSCHGDPTTGNPLPGGDHFQVQDCSVCHAEVVNVDGDKYTIIDSTLHINGKINVFGGEQDF